MISSSNRLEEGIPVSCLIFFSSNQPRIHEPKPSLSAARTIWEAAMPMSIKGKCLSFTFPPSREVILADSSTIKICTGTTFTFRIPLNYVEENEN